MKLKDSLLALISTLGEFESKEEIDAAIQKILSRQEKIFRLLFNTKDESRIKKNMQSFLRTIDEMHKEIFGIIKTQEFDPVIMYVANKPQFFVIDILEKFPEEMIPYSNGIKKLVFLYFARELSTLEKRLKDQDTELVDVFCHLMNCSETVTQIVQSQLKMNRIGSSKLPHFPEIFSYIQTELRIANKIKNATGADEKKLWKQNKEVIYYCFLENIDILSKIYVSDENFDYTVGELFQNLMPLKDADIMKQNDIKHEMFESRVSQQIVDKNTKPPLFMDSGPIIRVKSLVPRIRGFQDDEGDVYAQYEAQKFEKKKLKKKTCQIEKKLSREYSGDTRTLEEQRNKYQDKLDLQKEKNYKKLKTELERQQMMLKKEATTNYSSNRKAKKKGKRMAGNKTG